MAQEKKMTTGEEMLQFARQNQKAEFKQYEKAFGAVAEKLQPGETAAFSMVADGYTEDDAPGALWHLGIAVTQQRLLIGGERVCGRLFTRYGVDDFALSDILSVSVSGKKLVLELTYGDRKKEMKIEGENMPAVFETLKAAVGK